MYMVPDVKPIIVMVVTLLTATMINVGYATIYIYVHVVMVQVHSEQPT